MARRRSMNRRWSRRSMLNNTELDDNSEIINANEPMWWRHLEGDMTVRQSQRFSSANNTTAAILNEDSQVNRTDLTGEWWKNLDATNAVESPRRISPRKSVNPVETPNDSLDSEKSEDVSIKKRKVMLRVRRQKSDVTDNFSKALDDSETSKKRKSKNDEKSGTDDSRNELQRKRHRRSSYSGTLGKNDDFDSGNTSNDTDVIVKSRPKPFKKRVQSIDHQPFDDILQNEIGGLKNAADSSKSHDGINLQSSAKFVDEETPVKIVDLGLMRPPQRASHQKRMSSISRKLNLTSEESESDGGAKKTRPEFGTKKQTKKSINPFDEILSGHLDEMDEDNANNVGQVNENSFSRSRGTRNKSLSVDLSSRVSPIEPEVLERVDNRSILDTSRKSQDFHAGNLEISGISSRKRKSTTNEVESPGEVNRGSMATAKNDPRVSSRGVSMGKSYSPENSRRQRIVDTSENDEGLDTLSKALLGNKKLEVSITRLDPLESSIRIEDESENDEMIESNRRIRTLRSASRSRVLAYELPDKERSETPSLSENDIESPVQQNLTGKNSRSPLANKSAPETRFSGGASKTSVSRMSINYSRTKIFSDEDISIENMEDPPNNKSKKSLSNEGKNSRKSLVEKNRSRKSIQFDENISENEMEIEERSRNTQLERSTRVSGDKITNKSRNKSDENSENETNDGEEIEFPISNSKGKSSESRKSVAKKLSPIVQSGESITEDEIENAESSRVPENSVSQKSRPSRKSLEPTNESQRIEFGQSIAQDEMENIEEGPISENPVSPEKSRTSRKSLAASNKSRQFQSGESISEDEIENGQENPIFENPVLQEKSRTSLATANKSRRSGKRINEDEIGNTENNPTIQQNSDLPEKSHLSGKSFATANKSRQSKSDKSISKNEKEERGEQCNPENSVLQEKSHTVNKSLANKSRQSGRNIDEDKIKEGRAKSNLANSILQQKSQTSRKSLATTNISQKSILSDEDDEEEWDESDKIVLVMAEKSQESRKSVANKSRRRILSDDASSENENAVNPRKSLISNQSRKNVSSDKDIGEARAEDATVTNPKSTFLEEEKSRGKRSEASRRIIQSDDETNETEEAQTQSGGPSHMSLDSREKTISPVGVSRNRDSEERENIENQENPSSLKKVENPRRISRNSPMIHKSMSIEDSPFSIRERLNNISRIMPTSTPKISNLRTNDNLQKQKTITEFFPSKFLQVSDNSRTREPATSFDKEKFNIARKKMEEIKKHEIEAMKINAPSKKKETNFPKRPENVGTSKNVVARDNTATKKTKVIDKAYIVNGNVYKRPKLPRPKPWVTDRLYHHLWKLMEPKFKMATRVKSEKFIEQLSEIVALTIRRKKYDSYKIEIDCLMKDMAKLGIIKTRNDFYDFCYDFLPYDFRVKVTPILLPGNVRSIPYDPDKLHTPILPEN